MRRKFDSALVAFPGVPSLNAPVRANFGLVAVAKPSEKFTYSTRAAVTEVLLKLVEELA